MPYTFYKVLHLTSLGFVLISTAAIGVLAILGALEDNKKLKKIFSIVHGIFLVLALVSGFGLLARLGIHDMPGWVSLKIFIWVTFGVTPLLMKKRPANAMGFWTFTGLLFAAAAYLAIMKPF